jgi:hypothetical protein
MAQRAFFFVVSTEAPAAGAWFERLLPQACGGPLAPSADAAASLQRPAFFGTLAAARLTLCAVGKEWSGSLPRRFHGVGLAEAGGTVRRQCPPSAMEKRSHCLRTVAPGLRRLDAAARVVLNEPWDCFVLWLPLAEADLAPAGERLRDLLATLTPDIAVCGVLLSTQDSRWLWRVHGASAGTLPPRPVADVLPTVLKTLGLPVPAALPGSIAELAGAARVSGYTPQEEREIQKRLEDLGYL